MRVNLIAWNNGVGLTRDLRLLADALHAGGHEVHVTAVGRGKLRKWLRPPLMRLRNGLQRAFGGPRFDVNLMLERVRPEDFGSAHRTYFVPNPEWCAPSDLAHLSQLAGVLAKTQHAVRLFDALGTRTAYMGFTSEDRFDADVPRTRRFFHLAGRSTNKGTAALIALWQRHPEWPTLTIVQSPRTAQPIDPPAANIEHRIDYVDDAELKRLQNACRFHLCPSETEGYGHYLVEAMSVGAVVFTTDAEPMNELVTPGRGVLVAANRIGRQQMATTHFFDAAAMEAAIERVLGMPDAQLATLGNAARAWYLDNHTRFPARVDAALARLDSAAVPTHTHA